MGLWSGNSHSRLWLLAISDFRHAESRTAGAWLQSSCPTKNLRFLDFPLHCPLCVQWAKTRNVSFSPSRVSGWKREVQEPQVPAGDWGSAPRKEAMFLADQWQDYEVLDCGGGEKLERWGDVYLRRPDPQAIWPARDPSLWRKAQAHYHRSEKGGGSWEFFTKLPGRWVMNYKNLRFYVRPTGFKHTGLFPEQATNWDWMTGLVSDRVKQGREVRVLNLFAYTGGATMACAAAGAQVCHCDAAKGMVQWARENRECSGLPEDRVRWIIDDALKFVQREARRGRFYDGILMDPPSYGRGPGGEVWKLENELYGLAKACSEALSDDPLFFLINGYTTGFQASVLGNMIDMTVKPRFGGVITADEVCLPVTAGGVLPCGASGRWQRA